MERVQTKPFERWIGQTVYRSVKPSHGPFAHKAVGIRKGIIKEIFEDAPNYTFKNGSALHLTHFAVDIDWHTLEVTRPDIPESFDYRKDHYHKRIMAPFGHGLSTAFEYQGLCTGGLLGTDAITYDEPQSKELIELLPMYRQVVLNPDLDFYSNPALGKDLWEKA